MRIIGVLLLALSSAAHAEWAVDIHGFSKHFGTDEEYNETNPGLGIAHGTENFKGLIGFYKNSYSEQSYYLGAEALTSGRVIRFGVLAGGIYGYTRESLRQTDVVVASGDTSITVKYYEGYRERVFAPFAAPVIEIGGDVCIRVFGTPKTDVSAATAMLSARIYF